MATQQEEKSKIVYSLVLEYTEGVSTMVHIRDAALIKKIPLFHKKMKEANPNWESTSTTTSPIPFPYDQDSLALLFRCISTYVRPSETTDMVDEETYPEAYAKTKEELAEVCDMANYLGCEDFMHCIAFAIAKKLDGQPVEEIAEFLQVKEVEEK